MKTKQRTKRYLNVYQCPTHKDIWTIAVEGDGYGRRVTDNDCCSNMYGWLANSFELSPFAWANLGMVAFDAIGTKVLLKARKTGKPARKGKATR
jgi:hypothetical protein